MTVDPEGGRGRAVVYIDAELHDSYQRLTEGKEPAQSPFESMKDLFMWAACLGARRGICRPLASKAGVFRWEQFNPLRDVPLLNAIALAHTNDPQVILRRDEILRIAEEYANAGIRELLEKMEGHLGSPLWNLLDFVVKECAQDQESNT